MNPLFKISILLTTLVTSSCSKDTILCRNEMMEQNPVVEGLEYDDFEDRFISWDEVFSIDSTDYFVYFFSRACSHCERLKSFMLLKIKCSENIYLVEACDEMVFTDSIDETIGVKLIEDFAIAGYPSLVEIVEGCVAKNIPGVEMIKNELTN